MTEPVVRGAIVNELGLASRLAFELSARELRAEGVDPDDYGPLSFIGVLQPVTRTRLAAAIGARTRGEDQLHLGLVFPLDDDLRGELWILSLGYMRAFN